MEWLKWISGLAYALFSMVIGNSVLAVDYDNPHIFEQTYTLNPLITDTNKFAARLNTDTGILELTDADSVNASITDSELKSSFVDFINTSEFTEYDDQSIALFSTGLGGELTNATFTLSGLVTGLYTLRFLGDTNGVIDAAYDVTLNTVPLPIATFLFFIAVLGFTAISARHSL